MDAKTPIHTKNCGFFPGVVLSLGHGYHQEVHLPTWPTCTPLPRSCIQPRECILTKEMWVEVMNSTTSRNDPCNLQSGALPCSAPTRWLHPGDIKILRDSRGTKQRRPRSWNHLMEKNVWRRGIHTHGLLQEWDTKCYSVKLLKVWGLLVINQALIWQIQGTLHSWREFLKYTKRAAKPGSHEEIITTVRKHLQIKS